MAFSCFERRVGRRRRTALSQNGEQKLNLNTLLATHSKVGLSLANLCG